jgi:dihydroorotase-like cyclic amidohydrolase
MNYLLIKNGFVVKGTTIITEDLLVGGNKILQMGLNLERPTSETPVIDATGKYILPGAIDIDRHFLDLVHDLPDTNELKKLNQAQIFNGTTTMIDTIEDCYQKNYIYNIYKAKEKSKSNLIDYSFHLAFTELKRSAAEALGYSYLHEGVSTFFIHVSELKNVNNKVFEAILKNASNHHLLIICDLNLPENYSGETDGMSISDPMILQSHFKTLTQLVELGLEFSCPLLFLNVKFQEELELIQDGIEKGGDFYASLRLWFNLGSYNQVKEVMSGLASENSLNPIYEDQIWELVKDVRYLINPPLYNLTYEEDPQEELVYNRPDAYFYIRNYLSLLYSVGVMQKKISMLQLIDIVSTRPSKLMGLWPQKGILAPGADGDLVIWNPTFDRNLYCSLPNSTSQPNQNIKLKGRVDFVFVKGRMLYNGENFYPLHSDGNFVFRTSKMY